MNGALEDFELMIREQQAGLNNWLGTEMGNQHPGLFPRLLQLELAELYAELQPTKFTDLDQPLTKQRAQTARMELVDCFIVVLSQTCKVAIPGQYLARAWVREYEAAIMSACSHQSRGDLLEAVDEFREVVGYFGSERGEEMAHVVLGICKLLYRFGFTLNELLALFMAKRVLCDFRTNHGYARGGYRKTWWYKGFPVPDSLIAVELVKQVDPRDPQATETLYELMGDIYDQE